MNFPGLSFCKSIKAHYTAHHSKNEQHFLTCCVHSPAFVLVAEWTWLHVQDAFTAPVQLTPYTEACVF